MKVLLQSLKNGSIQLADVPAPNVCKGNILIKTSLSLISAGTERMLVEFGRDNFINKAIKQPDKVKQVVDKVKNDGVFSTYQSVSDKLDQPIQLGYSNVGEVIEVGEGVSEFKVGDRVISNGPHSEIVLVPKNLACKIPDSVSDEDAVLTVLASIGLQGIRLANPLLGETFLVSGLGLIGILVSKLLLLNGCRVLGIDPDPEKCILASSFGISTQCISRENDNVAWCLKQTNQVGVDGVIVTAATKSSDPIHDAAKACRKKGRIILVGVTGLDLRRDLFYEKELSFQVSCSYGPGRYDENYEKNGNDYPLQYVRWTLKRNFEAILDAVKQKKLNFTSLISKRFEYENAAKAYSYLLENKSVLGILLNYSRDNISPTKTIQINTSNDDNLFNKDEKVVLNFVGAGNYASKVLIPAFRKSGVELRNLCTIGGISSGWVGKKFGFQIASSDLEEVFKDKISNTFVIATRHDSHAKYVIKALNEGKNVFVEKPLCINKKELEVIEEIILKKQKKPLLMVGFNRRFSPQILQLKKEMEKSNSPKSIIYTCNAGYLPNEHWTNQRDIGGGRLLGEACHFVDLIRFLVGFEIESMEMVHAEDPKACPDTFSIQSKFKDGSIASIHYFSNGNKSFPKERIEVYAAGNIYQLNNFKSLKVFGSSKLKGSKYINQDKGQILCVKAFVDSILGDQKPPIPYNELFEVQNWIFEVLKK